jgi:hypothetical protein
MRGMRGRVWHGPMPATARSASLRYHRSANTRPDRSLADNAEAVFVLVGFRRFAQFSENQRQRADSGDEKACNYDHNVKPSKICAIISRFDSFVPQAILCFSIRGIVPVGECPAQTNAHNRRISFSQTLPHRVLPAQSVRFLYSFVQTLNTRQGIMLPPRRP